MIGLGGQLRPAEVAYLGGRADDSWLSSPFEGNKTPRIGSRERCARPGHSCGARSPESRTAHRPDSFRDFDCDLISPEEGLEKEEEEEGGMDTAA
ncbi:hypothetical protein INR49_025207 [Caranx melampygus]|nr:hypothetical protein INR49_025207 [Caranx melampygus]